MRGTLGIHAPQTRGAPVAKRQAKEQATNGGETHAKSDKLPVCGLVMPISEIGGCSREHWSEVKQILFDVATACGFEPKLVSDEADVGFIHKRIVENLYLNPIVVCDVSATNPNVMCELGMRLAFDKPAIIIKDDETQYSFDTSPIEHIPYPRDLHFHRVVRFKDELGGKLKATHEASQQPGYSTFLGHIGKFRIAEVETEEVPEARLAFDELSAELRDLKRLVKSNAPRKSSVSGGLPESRTRARLAVQSVLASWAKEHGPITDAEYGKLLDLAIEKGDSLSPPIPATTVFVEFGEMLRRWTDPESRGSTDP